MTPEQLVHLERYFAMDRNPTAARRKDISELLGMQERQTQIWFQNRRAKAKLQDGKHSSQFMDPGLDGSPLSATFTAELHNFIHEDGPVTVIQCTDLSIGTWRRIASSATGCDLVAYVSESKRCLTWFIHSAGYGFKMELPFHTIVETEFKHVSSGAGLAALVLSQPPTFYMEKVGPNDDGFVSCTWKRCSDWTEDHQASKVLRHTVVGSASQLTHLLRILHSNPVNNQATPPIDIQQQSLSGFSNSYSYHSGIVQPSPIVAGPPGLYGMDSDLRPSPQNTPALFPSQQGISLHGSAPPTANFNQNFCPRRSTSQSPAMIPSSPAPVELLPICNSPGLPYSDSQGLHVSHHLNYPSSATLLRPYELASGGNHHRQLHMPHTASHPMASLSGPMYDSDLHLLNHHAGQVI